MKFPKEREKKNILLEHVVNSKAEAGMLGIAEHQDCFWTQITKGPTICFLLSVSHICMPESVHLCGFERMYVFIDSMHVLVLEDLFLSIARLKCQMC